MYSASTVDNAMVGCFLHFHKMTLTRTKNIYHAVDHQLFASFVQSASQIPLKTISLPPWHNLKSKVPFKYLMMHFTATQCGGPDFNMNRLTVLTANAISALVVNIAYMRDPTVALCGTPSISHLYIHKFRIRKFYNFKFTSNRVPTGLHSSILKRLRTSSM